ncbi:unnamed protein product, partial [Prorocentrum cordatum]
QAGDELTFGVDPDKLRLEWRPLLLSYSSRLESQDLAAFEAQARAAGVFLTQDWAEGCTHLVVEHVAITPKLLCCVADGGVPVSSSFLRALWEGREPRDALPDARQHRPAEPRGADAAYAAELDRYLAAPQARRGLLRGVWVVFGAQQASDLLDRALQHAGAEVRLLCSGPEQCAKAEGPPPHRRQHLLRP